MSQTFSLGVKLLSRKELQNGNIIIYPTDTVWGMGCDPFNQKAIDQLFNIKGKKIEGLSVMFDNIEKIYDACETNKTSKKIIEEYAEKWAFMFYEMGLDI